VLIPAGKFWMGCNEAVDDDCDAHEYPYHEVYLDGYYIDVTEVTQAAFKECVDAGVCVAAHEFPQKSAHEAARGAAGG